MKHLKSSQKMPESSKAIVVAYVPVLHSGYISFFEKYSGGKLFIVGKSILKKFDYIKKDLRQLEPEVAAKSIDSLKIFRSVKVLEIDDLKNLDKSYDEIVLPDEDISHELIAEYLSETRTKIHPIFLRWDRRNTEGLNEEDKTIKISRKVKDAELISLAYKEAAKSSDIWRRVGAVLVDRDGKVITKSHNSGEPNQHAPLAEGDPRNVFKRGVGIEMSIFSHAEANIIAYAAKNGIKTEGCDIYVTTFPCPVCAKLIAKSGIKACYFSEGYAVLDGQHVLEGYGVKLLKVEGPSDVQHRTTWRPYPKG